MRVSDLNPNPQNPRKITDQDLLELKKSVDEFGEMKPVPGFSGYLCSKNGKVISLRRTTPIILRPKVDKDGYESVQLTGMRKKCDVRIHRIVLSTWHSEPISGMVCNHKNGIRNDNRIENLEWVTAADNERHARKSLGKRLFRRKGIPAQIEHC